MSFISARQRIRCVNGFLLIAAICNAPNAIEFYGRLSPVDGWPFPFRVLVETALSPAVKLYVTRGFVIRSTADFWYKRTYQLNFTAWVQCTYSVC